MMMDKSTRQDIGITKFLKANGIGALDYVMRFGKTRIGLKVASRFHDKFKDADIIVLVPSVIVAKVWQLEYAKFDYNFENKFYVMASSSIQSPIECGLLIVDELHKFTSDLAINLFTTKIKHTFRLGLTGSYPYNHKALNILFPVVDVITEEEAVKNKWISRFVEYNIPLELPNEDKLEYIEHSSIIKDILELFKDTHTLLTRNNRKYIFENDFQLIMACYSGAKLDDTFIKGRYWREALSIRKGWKANLDLDNAFYRMLNTYWTPEAIRDNVHSFNIAVQNRNLIHNTSSVKLEAVLDIVSNHPDRQYIIFSESKIFANSITEKINNLFQNDICITYHSGIPSQPLVDFTTGEYFTLKTGAHRGEPKLFGKQKQLEYILEMFKIGKYRIISTVKALDEGLNLDNIDTVITTSGTVNPTSYRQRSARGKTFNAYNPNKVTAIINLYFDDFEMMEDDKRVSYKSRDKTKLLSRQRDKDVSDISLSELVKIL